MKLEGDIAAVVTGGASGLGEATARALAAKGVKVALFDLKEDRGQQVASEIGGVFCNVNEVAAVRRAAIHGSTALPPRWKASVA